MQDIDAREISFSFPKEKGFAKVAQELVLSE